MATSPEAEPRLVLPIEGYLLGRHQESLVNGAELVLVGTCLRSLGFSYKTPKITVVSPADDPGRGYHRYGVTSPGEAAENGYHLPASRGPAPEQPEFSKAEEPAILGGQLANADGSTTAPAKQIVLPNGDKVPPGGCLGQARHTLLTAGGTAGDAPMASSIDLQSFQQSAAEAGVKSAFSKWSACMKQHGFTYAAPLDAMNDPKFTTPAPTALEKTVARTDALCKQQADVIATWYGADVALQTKKIAAAGKSMAVIKSGIAAELHSATQVLQTAGALTPSGATSG
ncbi:hypothetical protein [Streptacidiphilus cavernicola]|uniref:Uncharacterized protein n=1 Tax=Streptacidiphilus cavernicola TaxID=3342716 RepID=A0ABV6VTI1_9ACTN